MLLGVIGTAMQVRHLVEKDGLSVFILHAQVPAIVRAFLFSLAIMLDDPTRSFLVAFLEPEEKTIICPEGKFVGILCGIDVFIILVPAPHNPVETAHFFQWRLVKGVSAGLFFEGTFELFNALVAGSHPQPGFLFLGQFPFQVVTHVMDPKNWTLPLGVELRTRNEVQDVKETQEL